MLLVTIKFGLIFTLQVLRHDLMQALKKHPNLDPERIIFHQDNAPGHRTESTLLEISLLGFELLEHPPYSPDLAPYGLSSFPGDQGKAGRHTVW